MTSATRGRRPAASRVPGRLFAAAAVVGSAGAAAYGLGPFSSVAAQAQFDVLVSASTGGSLAQRLGSSNARPVQVAPVQRGGLVTKTPWTTATVPAADFPMPKGPWSTIVTGAISDGAPEARTPTGFTRVAEATTGPVPAPEAPPSPPQAAPAGGAAPAPAAAATQAKPLEALPPDATPVQQYCFNTADPAAEARFAWQAKQIKDMEGELEKRMAQLEAKTEEFKSWLARRDDFSKRAQEKLVSFYTRMRPDAAALQLAAMEDETAAAVLTKLEAKAASAVMAEMEPQRAAKLASIISGAGRIPRPKPPKPQADAGAAANPQAAGGAPAPAGTAGGPPPANPAATPASAPAGGPAAAPQGPRL